MQCPCATLLVGNGKRWALLCLLLQLFTAGGRYPASARALIRRLGNAYGIALLSLRAAEQLRRHALHKQASELLNPLLADEVHAAAAGSEAGGEGSTWDRGRALRVGGAALAGGAAIWMSAGMAGTAFVGAELAAAAELVVGAAAGGFIGSKVNFRLSLFALL
eukprot:SAG31_NODE_5091_length_2748_cov_16.044923_3_plen_163_part_00